MKLTNKQELIDTWGADIFVLPAIFDHAIVGLIERNSSLPYLCYDRAAIHNQLLEQGMNSALADRYIDTSLLGPRGVHSPAMITVFEVAVDLAVMLAQEFSENIDQTQ